MISLLDMSFEELENYIVDELHEKKFRAAQIYSWLTAYVPFEEMSNLSTALREKLRASCSEGYLNIITSKTSADGSQKLLLSTADGNLIETVLMKYSYGNTVCVSTQAGCAMGCAFCASCKGGLKRNLSCGEILSQVLAANSLLGSGRNITNIVLMGTGEPLHNYDNTIKFLRAINSEHSLNISYRNISLSTCGLTESIIKFAKEGMPITLSVSLHAAFDDKRKIIMPIAQKYTIKEIVNAAQEYFNITGRRVTFEYILIKDFNDFPDDVRELSYIMRKIHGHINLIPYNSIAEGVFKAPTQEDIKLFKDRLTKEGVNVTVRKSLGADIDGACGQLRSRFINEE